MALSKRLFPGESTEYRKHRLEVFRAEIALNDERENVARLSPRLPLGGKVEQDYVFRRGPRDLTENSPETFYETRLSELFEDGKDRLIVDHMMFGIDRDQGRPMCSI